MSQPAPSTDADRDARRWGVAACLAVGLLLGGLLVGRGTIGGDPDRMYRPIKAELARALAEGRLPFWSDRLGLGVPLVAESHAAAFYPANWPLYRVLDVATAYNLAMWLHLVALAGGIFLYARSRGIGPPGSFLAGLVMPFCGFLTVHATHEVFYHVLALMPFCLLAAERYAETGRLCWLAALALLWGAQLTLGHFQLQFWTALLALGGGAERVVAGRHPIRRAAGLGLGLAWGAAIAAVQLVPSAELARLVGQTRRSLLDLVYYSYPPGHWPEIVAPIWLRDLEGGPDIPYWHTQGTSGYEACLSIGTLPLLLAIVGAVGGDGRLRFWRGAVAASLALATMPRWWPGGYALIVQLPGFGYFRAPSRYMAIATFGLALLAGRGLDRALSPGRFRLGLAIAGTLVVGGLAWAVAWTRDHSLLLRGVGGEAGLAIRLGLAALGWLIAAGAVARWRRGGRGGLGLILALTAAELGAYYYVGGTAFWGRGPAIPGDSPALGRLRGEPGPVRVGGPVDDLPARAGLATARPYTGFPLPPPQPLLKDLQRPDLIDEPGVRSILRRYGVTHLVRAAAPGDPGQADELAYRGADPVFDAVLDRPAGSTGPGTWEVVRLGGAFPEARAARQARIVGGRDALTAALARDPSPDVAYYLPGEAPPPASSPRARSARVVGWDGLAGAVEHDGACDLVLARAAYPGWSARVDDGPERPVAQADGGLIAVRLDGSGTSRVALRYRPTGGTAAALVSAMATATALGVVAWPRRVGRRAA